MESGLLVFLFFIFWCIGLKVCNTFSLVIRSFFSNHLWIILKSWLHFPVALLVVLISPDEIRGVMGDHRKILLNS